MDIPIEEISIKPAITICKVFFIISIIPSNVNITSRMQLLFNLSPNHHFYSSQFGLTKPPLIIRMSCMGAVKTGVVGFIAGGSEGGPFSKTSFCSILVNGKKMQ